MNRLDELIKELCPEGMEYVKLKTICDVYDGTHKTPNYTTTGIKFVSVENINNLYATEKYISEENYNKYKIKPQMNDVLMTRIGTIGTCTVIEKNVPLAYYVSLALLRPNTKILNSKYLKYYIESKYGRKELYKRTLINAVPIKVNTGDIGKISIFVPPLEVQREIVRILDSFTEYTALLEKELALRKKQYAYYRNMLLDFGDNVERRTLGEIFNIRDGTHDTPKKSDKGFPLVTSKNIINGIIDKSSCYLISKNDYDAINQRSKVYINNILMSMIGTIGATAIVKEEPNYAIKNIGLIMTTNEIQAKFINFYLNSNYAQKYISENIKGTAPKYLSLTALRNFPVPFPPLEEQKRIVEILDKFDKLCNDLTSGLPAEINARKKQYAYYRDQLLSFQERIIT
ncbi:MAG: restriction endonuclease subunit S [Oscillospiraceae bacterium]|nr:restriction endonuclease subunit S [Oscillospiraceae bacterium]